MSHQWATADEISNAVGSRNWVVARRTKRIIQRYGEDVVCLTEKRYKELEERILAARK